MMLQMACYGPTSPTILWVNSLKPCLFGLNINTPGSLQKIGQAAQLVQNCAAQQATYACACYLSLVVEENVSTAH